jgi:hypothetical protein
MFFPLSKPPAKALFSPLVVVRANNNFEMRTDFLMYFIQVLKPTARGR